MSDGPNLLQSIGITLVAVAGIVNGLTIRKLIKQTSAQRVRIALLETWVWLASSGSTAEAGRRLASLREDLIARGVDPADLEVPLHPDDINEEDR